jgi:DNA-binding MarR family transcriptional regulator
MSNADATSPAVLAQATELLRSIWQLNHAIECASRKMEAARGVTAQQRMMIRWIGRYPGTTTGQLADHFCLDPATVTVAIDRLERKGLVERRRVERDRRRVAVGLTADGRLLDGSTTGIVERAFASFAVRAGAGEVERGCALLAELVGEIERAVEGDSGVKQVG